MSQAVIQALSESLKTKVAPTLKSGESFASLAKLHRKGSELAVHELVLDVSIIANEFKNLLEAANIPATAADYSLMAKAYAMSVSRLARTLGPGIIQQGNRIIIDTGENNYGREYDLLSKALTADTGAVGYQAVKELIIKVLMRTDEKNGDIQAYGAEAVEETYRTQLATVGGFDIGHQQDASNIINTVGTIIFNKIHQIAPNIENPLIAKQLQLMQSELVQLSTRSDFMDAVSKEYGISTKELFDSIIDVTIGFTKRMAEGKIHAVLDIEPKLNADSIYKVAGKVRQLTFPQFTGVNMVLGASVEKLIANNLVNTITNASTAPLKDFILKLLSGTADVFSNTKESRQLSSSIRSQFKGLLEVEGSPSILKMMGDNIHSNFITGKNKNDSSNNIASSKKTKLPIFTSKNPGFKKQNLPKPSIKPLVLTKRKKVTSQNIGEKDQTNIINIVNLINMQLAETIRQNMGSPRLNYRTGRFANSAKVLPGTMDKDGALRLPYTYMKYPYQTFEPGFARGSTARDPKVVIGESIKELAIRLVLMKMRVVRV